MDVQFEIKLEKIDFDIPKVKKVYDLGGGTANKIVVPYDLIIELSTDDIAKFSNSFSAIC